MQFISGTLNIPFMRFRFVALGLSALLVMASIFEWVSTGQEKFGVDFLGGTEVVVQFKNAVKAGDLRARLEKKGLSGAIVQAFEKSENDYVIRVKSSSDIGVSKQITQALKGLAGNSFEIRKEDFIGPIIGQEIRNNGIWALIVAIGGILVYVSVRFELRFALGAIVALIHDVFLSVGIYILCGREISAPVLAALLTILGYSLNDTIIVFDRIRENLLSNQKQKNKASDNSDKQTKGSQLIELINRSINQTLSRTILTSLTTLFVVLALYLFGGGAVEDLAFTLVIGVVVGTYSSVFIASPLLLLFAPKAKEKAA